MKYFFTLFFIALFSTIQAQWVSTYIEGPANVDDCLFIASDGTMYAARYTGGRVSKIVDNEILFFSDTLTNANGITEDSDGFIYVADNIVNKIWKFDTDGNAELFCDEIINPSGLAKMPESDTIIATSYNGHDIYKVAPDGTATIYIDHPLLNGPVSVNYDTEGTLYIANYSDGKILKYDHVNDSLHLIADLDISSLGFMCFAGDYLYVTSIGFAGGENSMIIKVDPISGDSTHFADNGYGYVDGDISIAEFQRPNGIVSSEDGTVLYVSEYSAQRIRKIELDVSSGVNDNSISSHSLKVFPNPNDGNITIRLEGVQNERVEYRVINSLGKEMFSASQIIEKDGLNLDLKLIPGVYFIQVEIDSVILTKKISIIR